jgi:hypothetical protein
MPYADPSGSFVHAALYSQLMLQVSQHLFPQQPFFDLSQDKRRIVDNETANLMLQARWKVDSKAFADSFAAPLAGVPEAPQGTILGSPVAESPMPGQFL